MEKCHDTLKKLIFPLHRHLSFFCVPVNYLIIYTEPSSRLTLCVMFCSERERGLLVVRGQKWHLAQRLRLPPHHVLLRELPPALLLPGRLQDDHGAGAEALHALPVQVGASATAAGFSFNDFITNLLDTRSW